MDYVPRLSTTDRPRQQSAVVDSSFPVRFARQTVDIEANVGQTQPDVDPGSDPALGLVQPITVDFKAGSKEGAGSAPSAMTSLTPMGPFVRSISLHPEAHLEPFSKFPTFVDGEALGDVAPAVRYVAQGRTGAADARRKVAAPLMSAPRDRHKVRRVSSKEVVTDELRRRKVRLAPCCGRL